MAENLEQKNSKIISSMELSSRNKATVSQHPARKSNSNPVVTIKLSSSAVTRREVGRMGCDESRGMRWADYKRYKLPRHLFGVFSDLLCAI
jgi:hypothetical protein